MKCRAIASEMQNALMLKYAAMLEMLTFCLELLLLRTDGCGNSSGLEIHWLIRLCLKTFGIT